MCLNLDCGQVNMINLRHFIVAKQIKFVHKIINSEPEHWNIIGKYWLNSLIKDTILKTFFFTAPTSRGYNFNVLPNFTKRQWYRGVPSEENYLQIFQFPSWKSKYVVITKFFTKIVPYFSNNLTKAD